MPEIPGASATHYTRRAGFSPPAGYSGGMRQTIVRIAGGEELRRHAMPGLVAAGLAEAGCTVRFAPAAAGSCRAGLELSDGRSVPVELDGRAPPGWLAGPLRGLGAEAVCVAGVEAGLEVLVEGPWLGEEVTADPASHWGGGGGPYGLADLRAACVAGRAEGVRRRFAAAGCSLGPGEAVEMVELDMAEPTLGVNPAGFTEERLRSVHGAVRDEMLRRGLVP